MSKSSTLHITYANKEYDYDATGEEYWLKMEQVKAENSAGKDAVADVIDTLYDIDVCNQEEPEADTEQEEGLPFDEEEFAAAIQKELNPNWCNEIQNFAYTTQIKVYRSHPSEPYRLNITNGAILQTVRTTGRDTVKITMNGSSLAVLPTPVSGDFKAEVSGGTLVDDNGNPIDMTVNSNSLQFSAEVHGSMSVSYNTEYDLVDVYVNGSGTEPESALAIAEYHGLFYELEITPPDGLGEDWIDREKYCKEQPIIHYEIEGWEHVVTCYEVITTETFCRCSGSLANTVTEDVVVPCPDGHDWKCLTQFSNWTNPVDLPDGTHEPGKWYCRKNMGSRTVNGGYVDCDIVLYDPMGIERDRWSAQNSTLQDPAYYEERCCLPPTAGLPDCQTSYSKNQGGKSINEETVAKYKSKWQDRVGFVGITPKDNDCGTTKTVISDNARNCCDGVPPLVWDSENSVEVLSTNSGGIVSVIPTGAERYIWKVRGSGFTTEAGRDVFTSSPWLRILTSDACGSCTITVTDGCSITSGTVISEGGRWEELDYVVYLGITGEGETGIAEADGYRTNQTWLRFASYYPVGYDFDLAFIETCTSADAHASQYYDDYGPAAVFIEGDWLACAGYVLYQPYWGMDGRQVETRFPAGAISWKWVC